MKIRTKVLLIGIVLLQTLYLTTRSQAQTIDILEPVEGTNVVFQPITPSSLKGKYQGRISIQCRVKNNTAKTITVKELKIIAGSKSVSYKVSTIIAANGSFTFQNHRGNIGALIVDEPFPSKVTAKAYLTNGKIIEKTLSLKAHVHDKGNLLFPNKASDLNINELWYTHSNHRTDHQVFALDMIVEGLNGSSWTKTYPGTNGSKPEHYRAYGKPIYAIADGVVLCAINDHTEHPKLPRNGQSGTSSKTAGSYKKGGNTIFIQSGTEELLYAHLQPNSIPAELLKPGAKVRKGQYIGKVGFSGDSDHPHIHIHNKKQSVYGCDKGAFRPMVFSNVKTVPKNEMKTDNSVTFFSPSNHSFSHSGDLIYPTKSSNFKCIKGFKEDKQYIGVWKTGKEIDLRVKVEGWTNFTKKWDELSKDNFRLVEIETLVEGNKRFFYGLFKRGNGAHALWNISGWSNFMKKWDEYSKKGLRLIDFTTYTVGKTRYYVGVFRQGQGKYAIWNITGWNNFTKKWSEFSKNGLRLIDLETFQVGEKRQYIGVFAQGNDPYALWSITGWSNFTKKWGEYSKKGLRLVDIEAFKVGKNTQYIGVFRAGKEAYALLSVKGHDKFIQKCEEQNAKGLRLVDIEIE